LSGALITKRSSVRLLLCYISTALYVAILAVAALRARYNVTRAPGSVVDSHVKGVSLCGGTSLFRHATRIEQYQTTGSDELLYVAEVIIRAFRYDVT